tara:strand:+ start:2977 stop:3261 length:285 start_codon:yes stop_codon:yes gene_type:complete
MTLEHFPNLDLPFGYWEPTIDEKSIVVKSKSLRELKNALIEYRDRNVLGGGNFGNIVVYKDDQVLGYFSYNGRLWSGYPKNWQTNEEIIVEEQE